MQISEIEFRKLRVCCRWCFGRDPTCPWCNGTGLCCPFCGGLGWLALRRPQNGSQLRRCDGCHTQLFSWSAQTEGAGDWQFDGGKCMDAINAYLDEYIRGETVDDDLTRRKAVEAERAEFEATRRPGSRYFDRSYTPPERPVTPPAAVAPTQARPPSLFEEDE